MEKGFRYEAVELGFKLRPVQEPVLIPVHDAASETFLCVQVRQETTPLLGGQNVRLEPSISSCSHKALKWE